ncbi:MAG: Holliday junction branch migration protein RuvA [Planctomycetota bacterium]
MIARIEGTLVELTDGVAEIRTPGGLVYELLVPACDAGELTMRIGAEVGFHTLHYLESQGQGSHFVPRLIGFSSREQRAFFELLTTVKGIGNRKALRAMQVSHGRMAEAIAAGDARFLSSLPEIGKRTAESTIVELKGKLDPFLTTPAAKRSTASVATIAGIAAAPTGPAADAEEILAQLGEPRAQARARVERVLAAAEGAELSANEIVSRALRSRGAG